MDPTAFETWVNGIAALTAPQRRQVWQAMAISEDADDCAVETGALPALADGCVAVTVAAPPPPAGAAGIAAIGQRRIDSAGCPHCESREVVRWGQASELPPIAAKPVRARSTR
jgi:hypothetical protein